MREIMKENRVPGRKTSRRNEKADRTTGTRKPKIRYENVEKPVRITLAESVKVMDENGDEFLLTAGEKITAYPNK